LRFKAANLPVPLVPGPSPGFKSATTRTCGKLCPRTNASSKLGEAASTFLKIKKFEREGVPSLVRVAEKVKLLMTTELSGALGDDGGPGKNWRPVGEAIDTVMVLVGA